LPELEQGEFYQHQLIGLHVVDERGEMLGRITGIIETGANDVFIVQDEDENEILIPAIDSVVINIDLGANQIRIRLMPGLIP
jgi:16S rRNA processing protein RimM